MESSNFHSYFSYDISMKQEVICKMCSSSQDSCLLVLLAVIADDLDLQGTVAISTTFLVCIICYRKTV